jgi:hypothetical protein
MFKKLGLALEQWIDAILAGTLGEVEKKKLNKERTTQD